MCLLLGLLSFVFCVDATFESQQVCVKVEGGRGGRRLGWVFVLDGGRGRACIFTKVELDFLSVALLRPTRTGLDRFPQLSSAPERMLQSDA